MTLCSIVAEVRQKRPLGQLQEHERRAATSTDILSLTCCLKAGILHSDCDSIGFAYRSLEEHFALAAIASTNLP
ncbi:hypothetical protein BH10PSE3_BH10PSE3_34700 [soil metagenome]